MDDLRFGAAIRAARIRRGLRQSDVARLADTSDQTVSRIERGRFDLLSLRVLRRAAAVLDVRIELLPRSRGADLGHVLNSRHAALAEAVIERLASIGGWIARPEVSFAIYGERGVVDILCWHAATESLLLIELKTAIVDVGELLGTFDRKRRLAPAIAAGLGWTPRSVSMLLIVGDGT